ncbi:zinc finger-like domain-containing protein [Micromonospora viridifaciens]|nr:zinc finger-like domain-containing protein [Micromonospora viridifaciens]
MGSVNKPDDEEGWSKQEAEWHDSLSIEEFVDLNMLSSYGVQDEEDAQKLKKLRESYEAATALIAGEYVFECWECDGRGAIEVIVDEHGLSQEDCSDCNGEGVQYVDEEEAAERIDGGYTPLRTPSA